MQTLLTSPVFFFAISVSIFLSFLYLINSKFLDDLAALSLMSFLMGFNVMISIHMNKNNWWIISGYIVMTILPLIFTIASRDCIKAGKKISYVSKNDITLFYINLTYVVIFFGVAIVLFVIKLF